KWVIDASMMIQHTMMTTTVQKLLLVLVVVLGLCQQSWVLAESPTATILYPADGAVNADLSQPIQWTSVANVQAYYLYVGTTIGAKDLVDTGELPQTSYLAVQLPAGQTIYARMWTKAGGVWQYTDSSFSAAVRPLPSDTGEWAFPRKDPQNTGHQTLPGRIRQPAVAARVYLGGELSQFLSAPLNQNN